MGRRRRVGFPDFDEAPLDELDAMMLRLTQYYTRIGVPTAASYLLKNGYLLTLYAFFLTGTASEIDHTGCEDEAV